MLYLTIQWLSSGEWMKVNIEILGSKATFIDPSGRNHPIEEGQGRIWKRWMRTGAQIAREQYNTDGCTTEKPAGFQELFFVFPAPHSYWYWLCFPCLLFILCIPYVRSWSDFISLVSFIYCVSTLSKKYVFLRWLRDKRYIDIILCGPTKQAVGPPMCRTLRPRFRTKLTKVIRSNYGMNAKPAG